MTRNCLASDPGKVLRHAALSETQDRPVVRSLDPLFALLRLPRGNAFSRDRGSLSSMGKTRREMRCKTEPWPLTVCKDRRVIWGTSGNVFITRSESKPGQTAAGDSLPWVVTQVAGAAALHEYPKTYWAPFRKAYLALCFQPAPKTLSGLYQATIEALFCLPLNWKELTTYFNIHTVRMNLAKHWIPSKACVNMLLFFSGMVFVTLVYFTILPNYFVIHIFDYFFIIRYLPS